MEPANLNFSSGDDPLETLLRAQRSALLADEGFSARVLAALPPRQNRRLGWIRICVLTVAALAGLALALWQDGSGADLLAQSDQAIASLSDRLTDPWLLIALVATVITLVFAASEDDPVPLQLE